MIFLDVLLGTNFSGHNAYSRTRDPSLITIPDPWPDQLVLQTVVIHSKAAGTN